jgi:DNA gyrase subunit A
MLVSKQGMIIRISLQDMSVIGRNTQGVRIIKLKEKDSLISAAKIMSEDTIAEEVAKEEFKLKEEKEHKPSESKPVEHEEEKLFIPVEKGASGDEDE